MKGWKCYEKIYYEMSKEGVLWIVTSYGVVLCWEVCNGL